MIQIAPDLGTVSAADGRSLEVQWQWRARFGLDEDESVLIGKGTLVVPALSDACAIDMVTGEELWHTSSQVDDPASWTAVTTNHLIRAAAGGEFGIYRKSDGARIYEVIGETRLMNPYATDDALYFRWNDELHAVALSELPVEAIDSPGLPPVDYRCDG